MEMEKTRRTLFLLLLVPSLLGAATAHAAAAEGNGLPWGGLREPVVQRALLGCLLLGACCGLLGSFLLVRRLSLAGDTLSHAVLPGIALAFLWTLRKSVPHLFLGALAAGLVGALVATAIRETTPLKRDTALGIVLGGFYALGIALVSVAQRVPGEMSGLKSFLFGSAVALSAQDLWAIAGVLLAALVLLGLGFHPIRAASFDPVFCRAAGLPVAGLHHLVMALLAASIVVSLQAVGALLASALLVIPPATAALLAKRLPGQILWSMGLGMAAGAGGSWFSALRPGLPAGPCIVLAAAGCFVLALFFAPGTGIVPRRLTRTRQARRIRRENTLKAIYHLLERDGDLAGALPLSRLVEKRELRTGAAKAEVEALVRHDLALWREGGAVQLTEPGQQAAAAVVRNHRLWEAYLANKASIAIDHVHDDAEQIEHILGEDLVRQLERAIENAPRDPHGSPIPRPGEGGARAEA